MPRLVSTLQGHCDESMRDYLHTKHLAPGTRQALRVVKAWGMREEQGSGREGHLWGWMLSARGFACHAIEVRLYPGGTGILNRHFISFLGAQSWQQFRGRIRLHFTLSLTSTLRAFLYCNPLLYHLEQIWHFRRFRFTLFFPQVNWISTLFADYWNTISTSLDLPFEESLSSRE